MYVNNELWNIIVDENMNNVPANIPGSKATGLTHDFCHLVARASQSKNRRSPRVLQVLRRVKPRQVLRKYGQETEHVNRIRLKQWI